VGVCKASHRRFHTERVFKAIREAVCMDEEKQVRVTEVVLYSSKWEEEYLKEAERIRIGLISI
jgi:GrpB-like predicted nucleotidyltransferase (UPF0157 family)